MKITLSEDAVKWYEQELALQKGDHVRFFIRYGGNSTIQTGFSLGIQIEEPISAGAAITINGINYFVEEADLWYFDSKNLHIHVDPALNEPVFSYK